MSTVGESSKAPHPLQESALSMASRCKPTGQIAATMFGWPATGGVWVLRQATLVSRADLPTTTDMEEHCAILKRLGATFYQDPDECEEVRRARGYRERGAPVAGNDDARTSRGV